MKAWFCRDEKSECDFATVVFAETRGKAMVVAMGTDACENASFTDIECRRCPQADKAYRGLSELDWYNSQDRIVLVRDCNFCCSFELSQADLNCDDCPAKEWCSRYTEDEE